MCPFSALCCRCHPRGRTHTCPVTEAEPLCCLSAGPAAREGPGAGRLLLGCGGAPPAPAAAGSPRAGLAGPRRQNQRSAKASLAKEEREPKKKKPKSFYLLWEANLQRIVSSGRALGGSGAVAGALCGHGQRCPPPGRRCRPSPGRRRRGRARVRARAR